MKKSILLFQDQEEVFNTLTDEQAGQLIKAVFMYNRNEEPKDLSQLLKIVFIPIRQAIDRSNDKYDATCKKNADNIAKRWNKGEITGKDGMKDVTKNTTGKDGIPPPTIHTDSDKDSDSDSDSDKEGVKSIAPVLSLPITTQPIVPQMMIMFKKAFPDSFLDKETDFKPCYSICEKIIKHYKLTPIRPNEKGDIEKVIEHWNMLLNFFNNSKWWSSKTIPFIDAKFSDVIQDFNAWVKASRAILEISSGELQVKL